MSTRAFHGARNFTVGRYEENLIIGDFINSVTNLNAAPPNRRTTSQQHDHQDPRFTTRGADGDAGYHRNPPRPIEAPELSGGPSQFHHRSLPSGYESRANHESYDEDIYTDQCGPSHDQSQHRDWDEGSFLGQDFHDAMAIFSSPNWPFRHDAHRATTMPVFHHHERTFNYFGSPPRVVPSQPLGREPSFAPTPPFHSQEPGARAGRRHGRGPPTSPSFPQPTHGWQSMQNAAPPPSTSSQWVGGFQPLSEEPNDMDVLTEEFSGVSVSNGGPGTAPSNSRVGPSGSSSGSSMSTEPHFDRAKAESRLRRTSSQESIPPLIDLSDD